MADIFADKIMIYSSISIV